MKTIAVLGSGAVGQVLADGFLKHGYAVIRGSREAYKLDEWKAMTGERGRTGTFAEAAAAGDIVVLAVKGTAAASAVELAGAANLAGKIVIDATNPIADEPPQQGVIRFFTGPNDSLMERLQTQVPGARFVKAFSSVGNALMVNPQLAGGPPSMFICGDDPAAKAEVTEILRQFGWEAEDCGGVTGARAIEPLCMLWCIPGILRNDWAHAYKVLRR